MEFNSKELRNISNSLKYWEVSDPQKECVKQLVEQASKYVLNPKTVRVQWTPAFQSYHSAGDEAEPFCDKCEQILEDGYKFCPQCGGKLDWGETF